MKRLVSGGIVALGLLTTARYLLANQVPRFSLEKQARLSDLVVVGRVESTRDEDVGGGAFEFARVRVETVLKGKPPDQLDVMSKGTIEEFDPHCCAVGMVYVFFLAKQKGSGKFESVNGPYGIYPIQK